MGCDAEMGEQRSSGSSSGSAPTTSGGGDSVTGTGAGSETGTTEAGATDAEGEAGTTEGGAVEAGEIGEPDEVALTPDNTTIKFIGTHADPDKPDPRECNFTDFEGWASINPDTGELTAVTMIIQTEGITSFNPMLTNHLKSPDFFDVAEYPNANFLSTSVEPGDEGTVTITGDLTLLGETKEVTFPATVSTEGGLTLDAEFTIDRTEWGMDFGTDNVLKEVQIQIHTGG
jgi:polyisoprenoid-binding protein YceI